MTSSRKSYAFVLPWPIEWVGGVNEVVRNLLEEFRVADDYHVIVIESHWKSTRPVIERRPEYTLIRLQLRSLGLPGQTGIKWPMSLFFSLPRTLWILRRLAIEHRIAAMTPEERAADARAFSERVRQALIEARRARDERRTIEGEASEVEE
jgi:hypothetical protein